MRKKHISGSAVWKMLVWLMLAGAAYLYVVGNILSAIVVGALSVLFFVIDIKATLIEAKIKATSGESSPFDALKKDKVFQIVVALSLLLGVQIVIKMVYERTPNTGSPAICLLCKR